MACSSTCGTIGFEIQTRDIRYPPKGASDTLSEKLAHKLSPKFNHECKVQAGDFFMFSTAKAKVYLSVGTVEV